MSSTRHKVRIGDLPVGKGEITEAQLQEALAEQKKSGLKLGRILVDRAFVEEDRFLMFLSEQLGAPFYDLKAFNFDPQVVSRLPETYARRYRALVLEEKQGELIVGMVDPIDAVPLGGVDMNSSTAGDCLISGTCNARILGAATRLVYGRLMVQQAYGPENLDLDVGLEAQIFEGGTFGRNLFDSCTTYAGSLGSLGGFQGNLQSTDTSLIAPVASTVPVGGHIRTARH